MSMNEEKLKVYNQMKMMDDRCGDHWVSVFSPVASNQRKMDDWKLSLLNVRKRKRRSGSLFFSLNISSPLFYFLRSTLIIIMITEPIRDVARSLTSYSVKYNVYTSAISFDADHNREIVSNRYPVVPYNNSSLTMAQKSPLSV